MRSCVLFGKEGRSTSCVIDWALVRAGQETCVPVQSQALLSRPGFLKLSSVLSWPTPKFLTRSLPFAWTDLHFPFSSWVNSQMLVSLVLTLPVKPNVLSAASTVALFSAVPDPFLEQGFLFFALKSGHESYCVCGCFSLVQYLVNSVVTDFPTI